MNNFKSVFIQGFMRGLCQAGLSFVIIAIVFITLDLMIGQSYDHTIMAFIKQFEESK